MQISCTGFHARERLPCFVVPGCGYVGCVLGLSVGCEELLFAFWSCGLPCHVKSAVVM